MAITPAAAIAIERFARPTISRLAVPPEWGCDFKGVFPCVGRA